MHSTGEANRALEALRARLMDRQETLVERANDRIAQSIPSYFRLVSTGELDLSGRTIIELAIRRITGEIPERIEAGVSYTREQGRVRQQQGLQLEDLLRAVRIDFVVLGEEIAALSVSEQLPATAVSQAMLNIWETLEWVMLVMAEGYRYQEKLSDQELLNRQRRAFVRLIDGESGNESELRQALQVLEIPDGAPLLAVACTLSETSETELELGWRSLGESAHVVMFGDCLVGLTTWGDKQQEVLRDVVLSGSQGRAVIAPKILSVEGIRSSVSIVRMVLSKVPFGRVAKASDHIVDSLVASQPSIASPLSDALLHGLDQISSSERARLFETLDGWMETEGTTSDLAEALFLHRNTVINRLKRVESLTGLSLQKPADVAALVAALRSRRATSTEHA